MVGSWGREDRSELATEKILAAAEKAFAELGVSGAGMAEIAEAAGCSRGTLYRYFPDRHALHLAYVEKKAREIVERVRTTVAGVVDPGQRLVDFMLEALRAVREDPATAAWFAPGASEIAARMSRSNEIVAVLSNAFGSELPGSARDRAVRIRRRFVVRMIVSLLVDPGESEAEERTLIEELVVPGILAGQTSGARAAVAAQAQTQATSASRRRRKSAARR